MFTKIFTLLTLLALAVACQPATDATATAGGDIPLLLERHPTLRYGKEWDDVQRLYGQHAATLRQDPTQDESWLTLAQLFANEARITGEHGHYYPAALQVIEQALADGAANPDLQFRLLSMRAGVELSQHEFGQALATAREAVALNPYNAQVYGALVDAYVELGDYTQAVAMADKMVSIRPDLRSYSRVSYLREIHGDVPGAIEAMQMAVSAGYPGQEATCWAQITLGELYERYGQPEVAAQVYRAILADRPNYGFAIAALARLDMENNRYAEAEQGLKAAAAYLPEVGFYIDLAQVYQRTQRNEEFAAIGVEIKAMLQDDVDSGHNMNMEYAQLYLELWNDYPQALAYAQKEYAQRPDNIDVNRLLARIYDKMNQPEQMQTHLAKAARTGSQHPELLALQATPGAGLTKM